MKNYEKQFSFRQINYVFKSRIFRSLPKTYFEEFQRLQLELENEPVQFITKKTLAYLKATKEKLANYIGCQPEDFFLHQIRRLP